MRRAVVLTVVLITFLLITILCGIILTLYTSQARLNEHYIRRIKAYYAALGGVWWAIDRLREGSLSPGSSTKLTVGDYNVNISVSSLNPSTGLCTVNATVDYSP